MFEKEAEEYLKTDGTKAEQILDMLNKISPLKITSILAPFILAMIQQTFKDGAEFGYNKANEWHYVKDGDLPEEDKSIMIYAKLAIGVAVGKRRKQGKVYEWYFATYDGTFCLRDKEVIAWKEIENRFTT